MLQSGHDFKPGFQPQGDEYNSGNTFACGELDAPDRMAAGSTAVQYSTYNGMAFPVLTTFWRE